MKREERVVFLALLTLISYATIMYIEKGAFIFPFPLNEVIFLIIALQFSVWQWKNHRLQLIIILISAIFGLISTQFFWSLLLDAKSMEGLVNSVTLDILRISYYFFIGLWAFYFIVGSSIKSRYYVAFGFIAAECFIIASPSLLFETLLFTTLATFGAIYKINNPIHLLWVLLASLQVLKFITISL
jgi:hypothetical protein